MLCKVCHGMLYHNNGRKGSVSNVQLEFWHHESRENLSRTAESGGCYICRVLFAKIEEAGLEPMHAPTRQGPETPRFLSAVLRAVPKAHGLYRLDFKMAGTDRIIASFALKEDAEYFGNNPSNYPISSTTADDKVVGLAKSWIEECALKHEQCRDLTIVPAEYPTRLIYIDTQNSQLKIRLVSQKIGEQRADQPVMSGHYASLSHCWGGMQLNTLSTQTLKDLLGDIPWDSLTPTFQHAITFAAKVGVHWIWIDALCILQGNDKSSRDDWLIEAARMREVYRNAYFNISATASHDGSGGLFRTRDDNVTWFDKVTLNTKELRRRGTSLSAMSPEVDETQEPHRCTILDLSFWDATIDNAPTNKRSWVFQERLLAPRVVHFCKDQIAFECRQSDRAECLPAGMAHYHIQRDELVGDVRLKSFDTQTGRNLRLARLNSKHSSSARLKEMSELGNPEDPLAKRIYFYELWKRIVDSYTRMGLSQEKDRLIALSGIARELEQEMSSHGLQDKYIAGMWQQSIATQLLWHVTEGTGMWRQRLHDSRPRDREGRPIYRAPSFSWASVENSHGITFPEPTIAIPLIRVSLVRLIYERGEDMYGLLNDGYIVLKGVLRKIELYDTQAPRVIPTRKATVHAPRYGNETSLFSWLTPQRTYFVSLGLDFRFTQRTAAVVGLCIMCLWLEYLMFTTAAFQSLSHGWFKVGAVIAIGIALVISLLYFYSATERAPPTTDKTNRYNWRIMNDNRPDGPRYENVYLDSPATQPSIFGPDGNVFCIPALEDDDYLTCLLVQALGNGDYGPRYQRIGLAKIRTIYGKSKDILNITTAPGRNQIKDGQYYWIPKMDRAGNSYVENEAEERDNESLICII